MVALGLQKHKTSDACGLFPAKQGACPILLSRHRWAKTENRSAYPSRGQSPSEKHDEQLQSNSSKHPKKSIDCGQSVSNRTNSHMTPWEANTFYSFCTQRDILRSEEPLVTRGQRLDFARACTTHPSNHLQPHRYPHCLRIFF